MSHQTGVLVGGASGLPETSGTIPRLAADTQAVSKLLVFTGGRLGLSDMQVCRLGPNSPELR